ncbi:MAG: class I SAM-dependent methyltransferase [Endomicrobia bacterium]|nr:class I SAM-dependent methyltransferase [Endomicrobiia bacterium]
MNTTFTFELISQWDKIWKGQDLYKAIENCRKDDLLNSIFAKYLPKNDKILEAGCGIGSWVVYLKELGYDIIGVDIVPYCIQLCKKVFPSVDIRVGDVRSLNFPDNFFGGYISLGVVEHMIEGPEVVLKEAKRVLKNGGVGIFTVPAFNYFQKIYFPLRNIIATALKENNFLRKILKKDLIVNKKEFKIKLQEIRRNLRSGLWPILGVQEGKPVFCEYRYPRNYLDKIFIEMGFKIIVSKPAFYPVVFYSTFGSIMMRNKSLTELNIFGKILKKFFDFFGPYFFNMYLLYVVRKI